jgi:hypothetical protein
VVCQFRSLPSSWQRELSFWFPSQALKYAFQTHDRLCFVMEYANGGEVSYGTWPTFSGGEGGEKDLGEKGICLCVCGGRGRGRREVY